MNHMKVALISALAFHTEPSAKDFVYTPFGNRYPASSKVKGHAARHKRQSKKRKAK